MAALFLLLCAFSQSMALQFVRVTQVAGNALWPTALAVDFTVTATIDVSAIGIVDADALGFSSTLTAQIVDRSTDRAVAGPVAVKPGDQRATDANPFVFKNVTSRLAPGSYCLIAVGTRLDKIITTSIEPRSVVAGDDGGGSIVITGAATSLTTSLLSSSLTDFFPRTTLYGSATFLFDVVPASPAPRLLPPAFVDCEEVACEGFRSGVYNIQGQAWFCDNDMAGGGWLRLWRANESSCEESGWLSGRNPTAKGVDPFGCRPGVAACVAAPTLRSPFPFNEVRGGNWDLWVFNTADGFQSPLLADGIVVRDGSNGTVWLLPVGSQQPLYPEAQCPCEATFRNTSRTSANLAVVGPHWTCGRAPLRMTVWERLFHNKSSTVLCNANSTASLSEVLWFQRPLSAAQVQLSVSICKDSSDADEDLKLVAGDLFVRSTVGFDRTRSCPTTPPPTTRTTLSVSQTASVISMPSAPSSLANSSETAVEPVADHDAGWIAPTAVAAVLALAIIIAVVVFVIKRLHAGKSAGSVATTETDVVPGSGSAVATQKNHYVSHARDLMVTAHAPQYDAFTPQESEPF